jgi:hypothetical protein
MTLQKVGSASAATDLSRGSQPLEKGKSNVKIVTAAVAQQQEYSHARVEAELAIATATSQCADAALLARAVLEICRTTHDADEALSLVQALTTQIYRIADGVVADLSEIDLEPAQ